MLKRSLASVACLLLMCTSALAAANSVELNFNDDSAQGRFSAVINQDAYGTSLLEFRGLYNDDNELNAWLASAGFDFVGEPGNVAGLELGIIADVKIGDSDVRDSDFGAVGVGALARYYPPALSGFGVGSRIVYSPKIFTFFEAERITEFSTRLGYAITSKIGVHLEFQKIRIELDGRGSGDLDEELRLGFEARF